MNKTANRQIQMFSLIEECYQGVLTRKDFCKLHSISVQCFYYWQKKYRQQNSEDQPGFIRVHPGNSHDCWQSPAQPFILTYPNGVSLQLPTGTPLPVIGSLLRLT